MRIYEGLTRNNKKVFISVGVVLCFLIMISIVYITTKNDKPLLKAVKEITVEYGEAVPKDVKSFLNVKGLTKEEKKLVLKEAKLDLKDIKNEKDKKYPIPGSYIATIQYEDEVVKTKVVVKDTIAPSIRKIEEIQVLQNTNLQEYDFKRLFVATDISNIKEPEFIVEGIDTTVPGEYVMQIQAMDEYDNKAEQNIKVVVVPQPTKTQEAIEEIITNEDTSIKVIITIKDKEIIVDEEQEIENQEDSLSTNDNYTQTVDLAVPYINQYSAGAPMGCEAASLLQALHYKGYAGSYDLSAFLREMPIATDGNPYHGFSNTPYEILSDDYYQSIFASSLANWGSNYGNVSNISGSSVETLKNELRNGNPIVIYVTYNFQTAIWQNWWFGNAINNMHVMTLSGFDEATGDYKVTDPAKGTYWVSSRIFEICYNYLQWAVVVR